MAGEILPTTGVIFTQSGTPVRGSADYQRVYDSRWKFMEIELEQTFTVSLPARVGVDPTARYYDEIRFFEHRLGFIAPFKTSFPGQQSGSFNAPASLYNDKDGFYFRRLVSNLGAEAQTLTFTIRLFNLDILKDYVAPKTLPQGSSSPRSNIGVKFLDGRTKGVDVGDNSPFGFSVDTTKKMLSIHRHGLAKINDYINNGVIVTAINTTTDTLTFQVDPNATGKRRDISWTRIAGKAVTYFPSDFVTYPAPLAQGVTYYVIPQTASTMKLATSYSGAINGAAIDLTSAGSLNGTMNGTSTPGANENAIYHNVGYPPTFMVAPVYDTGDDFNMAAGTGRLYIGPLMDNIVARVLADSDNLYFNGVQAVFAGWYAYIILKDPAEIAK